MSAPAMTPVEGLPLAELARLEARFPARAVALRDGSAISMRECGAGPVLVCLHGIGSGAASWLDAALLLAPQARVIAWDAPGYGESTPLSVARPKAADYAERLGALLDALEIHHCTLVGHSLGALTAAWAARRASRLSARIDRLVLISPAGGYGAPERAESRRRVHAQRLHDLAEVGIAGMAVRADLRLLSAHAGEQARQWVRWNMARLNEGGYRQAVELLCSGDLLADLPPAMPARVACGANDIVTPPAGCAEAAQRCGVLLELIADAGHASYVEQPEAVAALLRDVLAS